MSNLAGSDIDIFVKVGRHVIADLNDPFCMAQLVRYDFNKPRVKSVLSTDAS